MEKIILAITNKCMLDCKYCYVKKDQKSMELKTLIKSLKLFFRYKEKNKTIIFVGGEPLIEYKNIKKTIELCNKYIKKSINLKFGLATNGILLDKEKLEFFKKNNVSIAISLDGEKKSNDKNRILKGGKSYYDKIEKKLKLFSKYYNVGIRMTVEPQEAKNLIKNITFFKNIGFKKIDFQPAQMSKWSKKTIGEFKKEFIKILDDYKVNTDLKIKIIDDYYSSLMDNKPSICSMCKNQIAISPEGKIYPCQFFLSNSVINNIFKLGNVDKGILKNKMDYWSNYKVKKHSKICANCKINYICNKICLSFNFDGSPKKIYEKELQCMLEKIIVDEINKKFILNK